MGVKVDFNITDIMQAFFNSLEELTPDDCVELKQEFEDNWNPANWSWKLENIAETLLDGINKSIK